MAEDHLPSPPAPTIEVCYRHPDVPTRVHCTRCERPICPDCMIPAPVGFQCPECVEEARREFRKGPGTAAAGWDQRHQGPARGHRDPVRARGRARWAAGVVQPEREAPVRPGGDAADRGRRRAVLAAVHGDVPPRRPAARGAERVLLLPVRPHGRVGLREDLDAADLPGGRVPRERRLVRVRTGHGARGGGVRGDRRGVRRLHRLQLPPPGERRERGQPADGADRDRCSTR